MDRRVTEPLALASALVVWAAAPVAAQEATFRWSEAMAAGQVLEVRGIRGGVRATLAAGSTAEVTAHRSGRTDDFGDVQVHVERADDGVTLCVAYVGRMDPDDPCDWDDHHDRRERRSRRRSPDVTVDFDVRLPAGVELVAGTVQGDVTVADVRSDVSASTVNGDVSVSTSEVAWAASTVNGEVRVEMGSTAWDALHFATVSGDITLYLPEGVDTDLRFRSVSGDFRTDFEPELDRRRRRFVGTRLTGRIGAGGRSLSFNTVSGDVTLYRLRG